MVMHGGRKLQTGWHSVLLLLVCVLFLHVVPSVDAFRFTLVPGKVKCFTEDILEDGRYEIRYHMTRSLLPFVSVTVTSPGGRILFEHEVAKPDAKEIIEMKQMGEIAICFNTAAKASLSSTSMNVTLNIVDAEDSELTRMKKQRYSTSSPIALGAGKGSGALRQMQYIFKTIVHIRLSMTSLVRADEDMRYSMRDAAEISWVLVYTFVAIAIIITISTYLRLRLFMIRNKML